MRWRRRRNRNTKTHFHSLFDWSLPKLVLRCVTLSLSLWVCFNYKEWKRIKMYLDKRERFCRIWTQIASVLSANKFLFYLENKRNSEVRLKFQSKILIREYFWWKKSHLKISKPMSTEARAKMCTSQSRAAPQYGIIK